MHPFSISLKTYLLIIGLPVLVIAFSIVLAFSPVLASHPEVIIGITYDLTITTPLIYLLLIWNKNIPKITAVPVFGLGLLVGSFIIPEQEQFHLDLVKEWLLPVVELGLFGAIVLTARKTVLTFQANKNEQADFLIALRNSATQALGSARIGGVFATEIAAIYYAFFSWKQSEPQGNAFTYHKKSGLASMLGVVIFLLLIETFAVHLFLVKWNVILAWVLTISSLYVALQLFAHIKASFQRPIIISNDRVILKCGIVGEAIVDINNIESIELSRKTPNDEGDARKLAFLDGLETHNTVIHLKQAAVLTGLYGIQRRFSTLLLHVDAKDAFKQAIEAQQSSDKA